ncbi:hypothetical protein VNO78_08618 [Psophocarpus tetragonolobus]|uniref:Uncharacterized protein n=1 Tax=Psophocarpus tetragonolobus TaxID=3891 RepID=A0AAN9SWA7_PSOTE
MPPPLEWMFCVTFEVLCPMCLVFPHGLRIAERLTQLCAHRRLVSRGDMVPSMPFWCPAPGLILFVDMRATSCSAAWLTSKRVVSHVHDAVPAPICQIPLISHNVPRTIASGVPGVGSIVPPVPHMAVASGHSCL